MHRASERDTQREHPTQKPVALYEWTFDQFVQPSGIVVDPFAGSGSSLIACAQTKRTARLIELDPRYCDVIRRRWTRWANANNVDPGTGALDG
jgi:site-specific DNA-methyltransferase (adenine-specific)